MALELNGKFRFEQGKVYFVLTDFAGPPLEFSGIASLEQLQECLQGMFKVGLQLEAAHGIPGSGGAPAESASDPAAVATASAESSDDAVLNYVRESMVNFQDIVTSAEKRMQGQIDDLTTRFSAAGGGSETA